MHTNPDKVDPKSILIRLPLDLHQQVAHAAAVNGVSQNTFLVAVIAGALSWLAPDEAGR